MIVTADLAGFLILQLHELSYLAQELGRTEDSTRWSGLAATTQQALLDELWTGDRFTTRGAHTGNTWTTDSLLDLMPTTLGEHLPPPIAHTLATRIATHVTEYGPASELPTSPHYESDGYWRGPIWALTTTLIIDGLRRAGHTPLADTISTKFRALCGTSGFAENFDALTGAALRDRAYTWTASTYLILARAHVLGHENGVGDHGVINQVS